MDFFPNPVPPSTQDTSQPRKIYNFLRHEDTYSLDNGVRLRLFTHSPFFTGFPFRKIPTVDDVISRYTGIWDASKARHVVYDDHDMIVKWGGRTCREEAIAMCKLNLMNMSAVPQVYAMAIKPMRDTQHGVAYDDVFIYMEYMRGRTLKEIYPTLTDWDKEMVVFQLRKFLTRFRSAVMSRGKKRIQSLADGPVTDAVFANTNTLPTMVFDNVKDFSQYLMTGVLGRHRRTLHDLGVTDIRLPVDGSIILTHGNLSRANIIVSPPVHDLGIPAFLVGIVNWENAGWYPDFWEYTKAMSPDEEDDDWSSQRQEEDADWSSFWLPKALSVYEPYWKLIWPFTLRRWA